VHSLQFHVARYLQRLNRVRIQTMGERAEMVVVKENLECERLVDNAQIESHVFLQREFAFFLLRLPVTALLTVSDDVLVIETDG